MRNRPDQQMSRVCGYTKMPNEHKSARARVRSHTRTICMHEMLNAQTHRYVYRALHPFIAFTVHALVQFNEQIGRSSQSPDGPSWQNTPI